LFSVLFVGKMRKIHFSEFRFEKDSMKTDFDSFCVKNFAIVLCENKLSTTGKIKKGNGETWNIIIKHIHQSGF
jgi:hypothetical protein